jgi:hypothetical protein
MGTPSRRAGDNGAVTGLAYLSAVMSRHWRPEGKVVRFPFGGRRLKGLDEFTPASFAQRKRFSVPASVTVVLGAVFLGLIVAALWSRWNAPVTDSGTFSGPIEWNEVQAVPQRAPDAADVAWERRAGSAEAASGGTTVEGQHIYVIDGDTFDLNGTRIRVAGIDAPAPHPARCPVVAALGAAATQKLAELLRGRPLWVSGIKVDHWGRNVAVVRVNGEDVADAMIGSGLARNYDGKQREGWC